MVTKRHIEQKSTTKTSRYSRVNTATTSNPPETLAVLCGFEREIQRHDPSGLELRVPPLAAAAIAAGLMWFASSVLPAFAFTVSWHSGAAAILALIGTFTCLAGVVSFRRAKTTINPMKPGSTSSLVVSGVYRYTRNPMYLGFLLILLGWVVFLSNGCALLVLPAFVLWTNRFQISPEERMLDSIFADKYAAYRATVRRWL